MDTWNSKSPMIKRRTCVKDPSGDDACNQRTLEEIDVSKDENKIPATKTRNNEAVHDKEQVVAVTEKPLQYELQKKDEEIWKLTKRIKDLEKASLYPSDAKERTSQIKQIHEAHINEKYEKDLEDTKAREQNYARNAAILAKELKQEKLRHAETLKKLQETEQKLQNELKRKDVQIIEQLESEDFIVKQAKSGGLVETLKKLQETEQKLQNELKRKDVEIIQQFESEEAKSGGLVELDLALKIVKCHEIFICPLEVGSEQLADHLAAEGYTITRVCNIPGKKIQKNQSDLPEGDLVRHQKYIPPHRRVTVRPEPPLSKLNMFGKFVIGGITECIFRLHRVGLCLNGKFSLKSFHYSTSKKIKLSADLKFSASHRTILGMDLDYFAIHDIIKHILSLCQQETPFDLKCLLDLLCSQDPSEKQIIIRYNASLMDEIQKRNHFIIMYDRFQQIEQEDGVNSERIQNVLKFINPEDGWETRLYDNDFTEMVSLRHVVDSGRILKGKKDLLETWRHNFTHLHETCTALNEEDQVDIMDSVSKGIINQLQEGMHCIQELELPHLMHTMKK